MTTRKTGSPSYKISETLGRHQSIPILVYNPFPDDAKHTAFQGSDQSEWCGWFIGATRLTFIGKLLCRKQKCKFTAIQILHALAPCVNAPGAQKKTLLYSSRYFTKETRWGDQLLLAPSFHWKETGTCKNATIQGPNLCLEKLLCICSL